MVYFTSIRLNLEYGLSSDKNNSPVSHSARHQRPARERHKIRIASRENVDNQAPRYTTWILHISIF